MLCVYVCVFLKCICSRGCDKWCNTYIITKRLTSFKKITFTHHIWLNNTNALVSSSNEMTEPTAHRQIGHFTFLFFPQVVSPFASTPGAVRMRHQVASHRFYGQVRRSGTGKTVENSIASGLKAKHRIDLRKEKKKRKRPKREAEDEECQSWARWEYGRYVLLILLRQRGACDNPRNLSKCRLVVGWGCTGTVNDLYWGEVVQLRLHAYIFDQSGDHTRQFRILYIFF